MVPVSLCEEKHAPYVVVPVGKRSPTERPEVLQDIGDKMFHQKSRLVCKYPLVFGLDGKPLRINPFYFHEVVLDKNSFVYKKPVGSQLSITLRLRSRYRIC